MVQFNSVLQSGSVFADNLPKKRFASPTTEQFQPKRKSIESAQPLEV